MRRREFFAIIGGAAAMPVILPRLARAQPSTKRALIAVLSAVRRDDNAPLKAFVEGLRELGYVKVRILILHSASPKAVMIGFLRLQRSWSNFRQT